MITVSYTHLDVYKRQTLISKFILYSALKTPMMMTNIYPFLVGMAALKHEKIQRFPSIDDPDSHALGVHCGYFGFAPQSFCTQWVMPVSYTHLQLRKLFQ